MTQLKVRYSIQRENERYSFETWSDLGANDGNQLLSSFLLWERQLRKSATIHFLSKKMNLDSEKLLNVSITNSKKSPTDIG